MWSSLVRVPGCAGAVGSHGGGFHQSLLSKQLLEVDNVFLTVFALHRHTHTHHKNLLRCSPRCSRQTCVLTRVETGTSSQPLVPLLEAPEDCVEQHLVSGLLRRIQELPGGHIVMASCSQSDQLTALEDQQKQLVLL